MSSRLKVLAIVLVTIHQGILVLAGGWCVKEDLADPEFSLQAVDYQPESLSPLACTERCSHMTMKYAALRGGNICLCGNTEGSYGPSSHCNIACSGSSVEVCGGTSSNLVYLSSTLELGLTLTLPDVVHNLEMVSVVANHRAGSIRDYTFIFDDVTPDIMTSQPSVQHMFASPGVHDVTVTVTDAGDNVNTVMTQAHAVLRVRGLTLQCPKANTVGEPFICVVTFKEGSGVKVKVEVTDGTVVEFSPPDTEVLSYGSVVGEQPGHTTVGAGVALLLDDVITADGLLTALDVVANTSGNFSLYVYRPSCAVDQTFCCNTYTCIPPTADCEGMASIWSTECTPPNQIYSLSTKKCIYKSTKLEVPPRSVYERLKSAGSANWKLQEVSAISVNVHRPGFSQMRLQDVKVEKGDILAVEDPASVLQQLVGHGGTVTVADSTMLQSFDIQSSTPGDGSYRIRAHVIKPTLIEFHHNFTRGLLYYRISATVSSNDTNSQAMDMVDMEVQAPIEYINFEGDISVTPNTTIELTVLPHTGNKVIYSWYFGDGHSVENITYKNISHFYGPVQAYPLLLVAQNDVSQKEKLVMVHVQDPIINVTVTSENDAMTLGEKALIQWKVDQGTNVTYTISTEDKEFNMSEFYVEYGIDANVTGFEGQVLYTYHTVGNHSFILNASNLVSWEIYTTYFPVQKAIINLQVLPPPTLEWGKAFSLDLAMQDGSHVVFNTTLNGRPITNISMSDVTNTGYAYIQPHECPDIGLLPLDVVYYNLVTPPTTYSLTIKVQYFLTNVSIVGKQLFVTPGTKVTFEIRMLRGSDYDVSVSFGDGLKKSYHQDKTVEGEVFKITHLYKTVQNCSVSFDVKNDISQVGEALTVTIQDPVVGFTLTVSTPLALVRDASRGGGDVIVPVTGTATLDADTDTNFPTLASYLLSFGDGPSTEHCEFMNSSQTTFINSYSFSHVGSYNVSMNVSNLVSFENLVRIIDVDKPIEGVVVVISHQSANVSQEVYVNVTMTWGSRVNVTWIWDDDTTDSLLVDNYDDLISMMHQYTQPDVYTVEVTLTNSINKENPLKETKVITIQHPVVITNTFVACHQGPSKDVKRPGLMKKYNWRVKYFCNFTFGQTPYPTDAYYTINYGDDQKQSININITFPKPTVETHWSAPITYTKGNDYLVKIDIFNLVSHMHMEFIEEVIEALDNLKYVVTAIREGSQDAIKVNKGYFMMEDTINITIEQTHGTHIQYTWDMADGTVPQVTHHPQHLYNYTKPGHFDVHIVAQNNATTSSKVSLDMILHIQNQIRDIAISCPTPKPRNETFAFEVDFGTLGYESCYAIDFVEQTPEYAEPEENFRLYGNRSQCEDTWGKSKKEWEKLYENNANALRDRSKHERPFPNMTVYFTYWLPAVNMIKLYADNVVSSEVAEWRMVVTRGVCYDPVMNLRTVNTCYDDYNMCNLNLTDYKVPQHYRSRILPIRTNVKPNCTSTQDMLYTWTVHKVNVTSWENMEELGAELKETVLTSRELRIRYRILDYGVYRFTLNVSMEGEIGIEKVDWVEYEIIKTPLKGNIVGGREARYKWESTITIDASSQTYDPDVDEGERSGNPGMTFHWFCKRDCEIWPVFASDDYTIISEPGVDNCSRPNTDHDYDTGCLFKDGIDSPNATFTNTSIGSVTFNSTYMMENATYEVVVVAVKDTRKVKVTQFITIIPGDPPFATLICVTNCEQKYNPNDRFSVKLEVEGKEELAYEYRWGLNRVTTFGTAQIKEEQFGWKQYATTGVRTENLALDPGFFKGTDTGDGISYYFLLKVWRAFGPPDNYGTAAHSFQLNKEPVITNLHVEPKVGVACDTIFTVSTHKCVCVEVPITYDAFYQISSKSGWTLFWSGNSPEDIRLILPRGREPKGAINIKVRCTDRIGSFADIQTEIHCLAKSGNQTSVSTDYDEDASVEAKNIENLLSSDPARAPECSIELALPPAPIIIPPPTTTTTTTTTTTPMPGDEGGPGDMTTMDPSYIWAEDFQDQLKMEKENAERAKAKDGLASTFSDVIPTDLSQANIIAAAVAVILDKPQENNFNTLNAAMKTARNIRVLIQENIGSQEASAGQIDQASNSTLCLFSKIIETITEKAKKCRELLNLDMSNLVQSSVYKELITKRDECNQTNAQVEAMLVECRDSMTELGDELMKIKVNSESATILGCGKVKMNADKQFSQELSGKILSTEAIKVRFPTNTTNFFGGENSTAYAYEIQTKVMEDNPYSYANDSFQVSTPVMVFSLKNNSNGEVEITNSTEDLTIRLPRSADEPVPNLSQISAKEEINYFEVNVEPYSALLVRVTPYVNTTDNGSTTVPPAQAAPPCQTQVVGEGAHNDTTQAPQCLEMSTESPAQPENSRLKIQANVSKEWEVYIKEATFPDIDTKDYEFNCSLPLDVADAAALLERTGVRPEDDDEPDMYTCFIPAEAVNRNYTAKFFVAIKKLTISEEAETPKSRGKRSVDETGEGDVSVEPPAPTTGTLELRTSKCVSWDDGQAHWSPEGCRPGPMTKGNTQQCLCKKTGTFAADYIVQPNLPQFNTNPFSSLNEEPTAFCVMLSILCFYFVCLIWAKKADQRDVILAGVVPLADNTRGDSYLYELIVYTGSRSKAGTTARVYFMLVGEEGETAPRRLHSHARPALKRGGVDMFVMSVSASLGRLTHIRIWHDNSGSDPAWFFSRMQVTDVQTGDKVYFMCDRWLAVEEGDGLLERIVPIAGSSELVNFQHLFFVKTRKNLSDSHLWFSVLQRPPRSRFTRVQRLTCCLVLIFTAMMASIMFYGKQDEDTSKTITIGPIRISLGQIFIGVISSLVAIPASMIVITLFRYARPKPIKNTNQGKKDVDASTKDINISIVDIDAKEGGKKGGQNSKRTRENKGKGKKKKFSLPYWCVYVGYVLSALFVLTTFYMVFNIAVQFGRTKSQQWLLAFVLSFFESVLISQPVKVFMLATIYALLIKKPDTEEEEEQEEQKGLGEDEEWLNMAPPSGGQVNQPTVRPPTDVIQPLDDDLIHAARTQRMQELQMRDVIWDVATYVMFLVLLMIVAYGNKSPHAFNLYTNFKHAMVDGAYGNKNYSLQKVTKRELLWEFVDKTLLPSLYSDPWYNGATYWHSKGYFADKQALLMGQPRLRLLRTHTEPCHVKLAGFPPTCRPAYGMFDQDEAAYKQSWVKVNLTDPGDRGDPVWSYSPSSELEGYPVWGDHATYAGGGYVAALGRTQQQARAVTQQAIDNGWLDRLTRAVFVEFLVYNDNVKLFGACTSIIEFIPTGGIHSNFKFYVIRLNPYVGPQKYVTITTEVLLLFCIIYFFFLQLKLIYKQRMAYFKKVSNCCELALSVICVTMVVYFFYRLFVSMEMEKQIKETPNEYHNFDFLILLYETYNYLLAFVTAISTVKLIQLLRFNKKMSMLGSTLLYCMKPLVSFFILFGVVFIAYTFLIHLMLGRQLYDHSTTMRSSETMLSAMLNKFDYDSVSSADPTFGPVILISYTVIVGIILLNVMITVIIEAFAAVKYDLSKQSNEHEIVDFIVSRIAGVMGRQDKALRREYDAAEASVKMNSLYKEGGPTEDLGSRVDQLLGLVERFIVIQPEDKQTFQKEKMILEEEKKTKLLYIAS